MLAQPPYLRVWAQPGVTRYVHAINARDRYEQSERENGPRAAAAAAAREREAYHAAAAQGVVPSTAVRPQPGAAAPRSAPEAGASSGARSAEQLTVALQLEFAKLQAICETARGGGASIGQAVCQEALLALLEAVSRTTAAAALCTRRAEVAGPLATAPDALAHNSTKRLRSALESKGGTNRGRAAAAAAEAAAPGDIDGEDAPMPDAQPLQTVYKPPKKRKTAPTTAGHSSAAAAPPAAGFAAVTRVAPAPTAAQVARWPAHTQPCSTPSHGLVQARPLVCFTPGVELGTCPECRKTWPRFGPLNPTTNPNSQPQTQSQSGAGGAAGTGVG